MLIENLAYHKLVEVHWAGEDGVWHTLRAGYHSSTGTSREVWRAQATFNSSDDASLPGDVEFALRYRVLGAEYWDKNDLSNYFSNADSVCCWTTAPRCRSISIPFCRRGNVTILSRSPYVTPGNPSTSTFTGRRTTGATRRLRPASSTGRTGTSGAGAAQETPIAMIRASGSARSGSTTHSGLSTQSAVIRRTQRSGTTISATTT